MVSNIPLMSYIQKTSSEFENYETKKALKEKENFNLI